MVDRLSFFGLGKLGLPLAALFARSGLRTFGIDRDPNVVQRIESGDVPLDEPGLARILSEAMPNLSLGTDASRAAETDASIILVPTPSDPAHPEYSSAFVEDACEDLTRVLLGRPLWRYHLIAVCSTLWPGTLSKRVVPLLEAQLGRRAGEDFGVVYVPEFVALGQLVNGFQHPAFLLVGTEDDAAGAHAAALFSRIIAPQTPVRFLSSFDAELAKLALNVFSCVKISFGNFLAQLGDRLGGIDVDGIAAALALDPRVGVGRLDGGAPYGGPCLPRDVDALLHLARSVELDAPLARAAAEVNALQYDLIERYIIEGTHRRVALLGLSFKAGTSVTEASTGFELTRRLLARSIGVIAFDPLPQARASARRTFGSALTCVDALPEAVSDADTLVVCNPDPLYAGLAAQTPADRRIVDPWGCVRGCHPGLIRPGRMSNRTAATNPA